MARILYFSIVVSVIGFVLAFGIFIDAISISHSITYDLVIILCLGIISTISSILGLKECSYESAMTYTQHEEVIATIKKEIAVLALCLSIAIMLILVFYALLKVFVT